MKPRKTRPLAERFWAKVVKGDGCWLWTGGTDSSGYGTIGVLSKPDGSMTHCGTHRVVYELTFGQIPVGMFVLHRCDVRACVRPDHLFLGSNQDNMDDMWSKGRGAPKFGEAHWNSRLTEFDVRQIRTIHSLGVVTQENLGRLFGVHQSAISKIVNGERRAHASATP